MFSGLLQIDLFKGKWSLAKSYFKQNYCHACHKRFAFFFPLPLSSLLFCHGNCGSKIGEVVSGHLIFLKKKKQSLQEKEIADWAWKI